MSMYIRNTCTWNTASLSATVDQRSSDDEADHRARCNPCPQRGDEFQSPISLLSESSDLSRNHHHSVTSNPVTIYGRGNFFGAYPQRRYPIKLLCLVSPRLCDKLLQSSFDSTGLGYASPSTLTALPSDRIS